MPMPAFSAWLFTVLRSQLSVGLRGSVMTFAPTDIFAIHFDIASEMNEPPMPMTAAMTSSA